MCLRAFDAVCLSLVFVEKTIKNVKFIKLQKQQLRAFYIVYILCASFRYACDLCDLSNGKRRSGENLAKSPENSNIIC